MGTSSKLTIFAAEGEKRPLNPFNLNTYVDFRRHLVSQSARGNQALMLTGVARPVRTVQELQSPTLEDVRRAGISGAAGQNELTADFASRWSFVANLCANSSLITRSDKRAFVLRRQVLSPSWHANSGTPPTFWAERTN